MSTIETQKPVALEPYSEQHLQSRGDEADEISLKDPLPQLNASDANTLAVDFSWRKFKARIIPKGDAKAKPLYIVESHTFRTDCLTFEKPVHSKLQSSGSSVDSNSSGSKTPTNFAKFASGRLHAISINADCEINSRSIKIEAMKRFKTEYTHYSTVLTGADGTPMQMRWVTTWNLKDWKFICLDENQVPVAQLSSHVWAPRKVGTIEFVGELADREDVRDEIVVTGITLICCMFLRTNNIFNLFGAFVATPGKYKESQAGEDRKDK